MKTGVRYSIGLLMIILNVVFLVLESEVYQGIQEPDSPNYYNKPYFITWFSGVGYAFFIIPFLIERVRYQIFTQKRSFSNMKLFETEEIMILKFSLIAYVPYYLSGYAWMISLPATSVSANLIIYNSVFVFVFIFSYLILRERVNAWKISSIVICFLGILITTFSSVSSDDESGINQTVIGYVLLMLSVVVTALYDVLYKFFSSKYVNSVNSNYLINHQNISKTTLIINTDDDDDDDDHHSHDHVSEDDHNNNPLSSPSSDRDGKEVLNVEFNELLENNDAKSNLKNKEDQLQAERLSTSLLCTGAIGILALLTLWPGIFLLDILGIESFEMPTFPIIEELLLAVLFDGFQNSFSLAGMSFTSPLFMSIGNLISMPLSIIADMIFHDYLIPWFGFIGVFGIFFGFLLYSYAEFKIII